ncbi:MAG: hypothetical protein SF070_08780 [Gemmatimonadota bacterium]|nr:hypothetical protein [Gemmatimonadota bacterium]
MTGARWQWRMGTACAGLLALAVAVAGGPDPARNRWVCQGADGTVVAAWPDEARARASCQERAQAAAGGIFIVVPGTASGAASTVARPVILKPPRCGSPGPCPANLPLSGRRGSWSWVPPTRLENGNIATDLSHFAMFRQAAGGQPEEVAEISPTVTNVYWGMDTRDANACFWIEAVRVNSAPMPSDRSNRICIDADGQLLPRA